MPYKDPEVRKRKNAEYSKRWYQKNKQVVIDASKETKLSVRRRWHEFKSTLACIRCGENHISTLDFHHVDSSTKDSAVHKLISNGAYAKALKEIEKCIVLCANCHRKHHYEERKEQRRRRKKKKGIRSSP